MFESDRSPPRFMQVSPPLAKAPEPKIMSVDGLFDRITGKIVRRSVLGSDRTDLSGAKLIGQLVARRVSGKSSKTGVSI